MRLTREEYARLRLQRPDMFSPLDSGSAPKPSEHARMEERKPSQPARQTRHRGLPVIRVTFIAAIPKRIDPGNLSVAFKGHQDAVAESLGLDDGDLRFAWEYEQIETRGTPGVIVKLELETMPGQKGHELA